MSRAEHTMSILPGALVHDVDGKAYVFLGWLRNTAGLFPYFHEVFDGQSLPVTPLKYHCADTETLLRKFPDAIRFCGPRAEHGVPLTDRLATNADGVPYDGAEAFRRGWARDACPKFDREVDRVRWMTAWDDAWKAYCEDWEARQHD